MTGPDLDLALLKKSLAGTLESEEPDAATGGPRFIAQFMRHYIQGPAVTMLPMARLDHLQSCIEDLLDRTVPGDLMETGIWRGGAVILMRAVLKARHVGDRRIWAADSFEGLPEPDAQRFPREAAAHHGPVMRDAFRHFAAGIEEVRANFRRYGLLDEQVCFLEGWFRDTLPDAPVRQLALLRLDGDYYESTMDALVHLYDRVSVGGYVIVDDYGEEDWTHCREAVDSFRLARNIDDPMLRVDHSCWYWIRSR